VLTDDSDSFIVDIFVLLEFFLLFLSSSFYIFLASVPWFGF